MEQTTLSNAKETAKLIRRSFRTLMSGPTSQSMREKGLEYHVNWGISFPHLQELASEFTPDFHVAIELWKDSVRESKLMALMLMPREEFTSDIASLWTETLQTQEVAEMAAMLLYQHADYASVLAFRLLSMGDRLQQILAYNILARLFGRDMVPDERGLNELLDQASLVLESDDIPLRHAALNCLQKLSYAQEGLYSKILEKFIG